MEAEGPIKGQHRGNDGSGKNFVDASCFNKTCIWDKKIQGTQFEEFMNVVNAKYGTNFRTYWDLHDWSIKHYANFWEEVLLFFKIIYTGTYTEVAKMGESIIDVEWFVGAKMNYAENLLRIRDERIALICVDEEGTEESVTYAEMYEEAKMYGAAFKKLGLKEGDVVACYMANRKEAIFAMLGVVSLGGIWGGPLPHYGAQTASIIVEQMKPKFLFTMDRFQENKVEINLLQNIPEIANDLQSLLKVVIVPTKQETFSLDISGIKNSNAYSGGLKCGHPVMLFQWESCFLSEFLECGRDSNGQFPEMEFVQLPFNHPIFLNFTSGTTGPPKRILHSSSIILAQIRTCALGMNITQADIVFTSFPVGWTVWNAHLIYLMVGATILLFNGNRFSVSKTFFWDLLEKYKVTYSMLSASTVEKMEKQKIVPGPNCNLEHLRMIAIGGSPVKLEHCNFIRRCVRRNDIFLIIIYGSTEIMGAISGVSLNLPHHASEMQAPALGIDVKCFDVEGNSVVGQYGELVISNPNPAFPLGLMNDPNKEKLYRTYFSKYKGVWCQHDECWINPKTKGFVVIGRSDDTLTPYATRFGAAEIYFSIHDMEELEDYLCVGQRSNRSGDSRCILFVKMKMGHTLNQELTKKIGNQIESELSDGHIPEVILEVPEIPYNLNNKRMEGLVRSIISTNQLSQFGNVKNPGCLKSFVNIPELQDY